MIFRLILLVFAFSPLWQVYSQRIERARFENIRASEFGCKTIRSQVWSKDGSFWAVTEKGIINHNGYASTFYSADSTGKNNPLSNSIIAIQKTGDAEFWVTYADTAAISKLDVETKEFKHFYLDELHRNGQLSGVVAKVKRDSKGQLWIASWGEGLLKYDEEFDKAVNYRFEFESKEGFTPCQIKDFVELGPDSMLVTFFKEGAGQQSWPVFFTPSTGKHRQMKVNDLLIHLDDRNEQQRIETSMRIVHFVHRSKNGEIWFGTYSGLILYDPKAHELRRIYREGDEKHIQNIANLQGYVVNDYQLWMMTPNQGVAIADMDKRKLTHILNDPLDDGSLEDNRIQGLSEDPLGHIWVSSESGDISIFAPYKHNFALHPWNGLGLDYSNRSEQVIPVGQLFVKNSKEIYISSRNGLTIYDGQAEEVKKLLTFIPQGISKHNNGIANFKLNSDRIEMILNRHPANYYQNEGKLEILADKMGGYKILFRHVRKPTPSIYYRTFRKVTTFFSYQNGQNGLKKFDSFDLSGNALRETFSFVTNQGKWMMPTNKGRFILYEPESKEPLIFGPNQESTYFPDSTVISAMLDDDFGILIGTSKGLYSFDEETLKSVYLNEEVGLKDNDPVKAMIRDKENRLWLALENELLCWDPGKGSTVRYGKSLGVNVGAFLPAVGQIDELGQLYFASMKGMIVINPEKAVLPPNELELHISSVSVNEDPIENKELNSILKGGHSFHWEDNFLGFTFHTNQVFAVEPHEFHYRLVGLDSIWQMTTSNDIKFKNLQYGEYVLEVKAVNAYNRQSGVVRIPFTVRRPYWLSPWFYATVGFIVLIVIVIYVKRRERVLKKRSEELERTVKERTVEVVKQKKEAEFQREMVEEKQKEITDSISYAKRIQEAILPADELFNSCFSDCFVLYKPKDIVAGDFYWLEVLSEDKSKVIFAAADCTGHGVPGAMVSVVCNNALNRAVREFGITDAAELLNKTRELVIEQFEKGQLASKANGSTIKDGMDISLCVLDKNEMKVDWAGANNPLWILRGEELIEIKGDKQPIGKYEHAKSFSGHVIDLQQGDTLYLFSDGYADQFGGEKGKKFKYSSLRKLFKEIGQISMIEQQKKLDQKLEEWMEGFEQVDDVCVVGVRV